MCIGAYCTTGIMVKMMPNMTGLAIGVLIGFALSTIVALIVSIPTLRLKGDYLAIATLGFYGKCTYPSAKYGNHKWSGLIKWNS